MSNEEVTHSVDDCRTEMKKLRTLIDREGTLSPITHYLTKYAAIRCCGALEQGYKSIIADYYEQYAPELAKFISTHVRESSMNPSFGNIMKILHAFDDDKADAFKRSAARLANAKMLQASLESLNDIRNSIAHGLSVTVSFNEIDTHFSNSVKILECLDGVCSKSTDPTDISTEALDVS